MAEVAETETDNRDNTGSRLVVEFAEALDPAEADLVSTTCSHLHLVSRRIGPSTRRRQE